MATKVYIDCCCGGHTYFLVNSDNYTDVLNLWLPSVKIIFKEDEYKDAVEDNFNNLVPKLPLETKLLENQHITWEKHRVSRTDYKTGIDWKETIA